jgi:SPP1 family predicted phage head-tail adaptor
MKNANKYNQLIKFWIPSTVGDGSGGTYPKYSLDFEDYALVITKDEKRTLQESQIILDGYYEVYLRYRSDIPISKKHNIKMKGKDLTIHSIVNINELDKEFKLICTESDNHTEVYENDNPYENYQ